MAESIGGSIRDDPRAGALRWAAEGQLSIISFHPSISNLPRALRTTAPPPTWRDGLLAYLREEYPSPDGSGPAIQLLEEARRQEIAKRVERTNVRPGGSFSPYRVTSCAARHEADEHC